jgi:small-conductance mechanosensitive channel
MKELEELIRNFRRIFEAQLFKLGETPITLIAIIELVLIIVVAFFVSKIVRKFFRRRVLSRFKLDDGSQFVILRLIHYVLMVIGLLLAINVVGIQLTSLAVIFGLIGVGIAFGLQNITSNFVSGVILLFEPSVDVGDYIQVGEIIGRVSSINMRSTTIITPENITLIVPNSRFIEETVTNWSVGDLKIRTSVRVGVAYGSDTELVTRLLLKAAEDHPTVLPSPEPDVLFNEFGDSSLNFELRVWIPNPNPGTRKKVISDLNYAVDAAFRESKITIPFPQRDVHLLREV